MDSVRPLTADLLLEHRGFLHGVARSLLQDEQRAEDVVQETYLAALRRPPPPQVRLRAWLAAVARNLALRARRREARLRRREGRAARPESQAATADVAARVEVQRRLAEAVAALPEPGRSAVVWHHLDGISLREIARREDVAVRTIESRLRRARARLRASLDAAYGGRRATWHAALAPVLGLASHGALSSSAASTAATSSGTAGSGGGAAAATAIGASIVSTKILLGVAVACVAGAFFAGRRFPASSAAPSPGPAVPAEQPAAHGPVLHADAEQMVRSLRQQLADVQKTLGDAKAANRELRTQVETARKAGYLPAGAHADAPEGPQGRYAPAKYEKAVTNVTWPEAGEAAAKMVPLLDDLAKAFGKGADVDPKVGLAIFKWNQKLQNVAVAAIAAGVPGGTGNGPFTHPVVAINLIEAALEQAGVPLDDGQRQRLGEIGDRYIEQDERRQAGYTPETFKLQKLIDECALKDTMFTDIDALLTPRQRDVLHPEGVRDRLGIDLYSSGTMWYTVAQAVDFTTRDDLAEDLVRLYRQKADLGDDEVASLRAVADEWARGFSDEFLQASADPIAQASRRKAAGGALAGWQRLAQVRVAAQHQLALDKALLERLGPDSPKAALVRGDARVFVPLARPAK